MKIYKKIRDIQALLNKSSQSVGFVPTMGALHAGHLKLVQESRQHCNITVVSIFVNPTQFNDPKDLEKYPRTIESDITELTAVGCDLLFLPEVEEMYPETEAANHYDLGQLERVFEGAFRPGHFQGVCQVVDKLFRIIQPTDVFFGQKDYQQCMVVKKLIKLTPDFHNITMHIIPTMREESGLAMSSRNMRLTGPEKEKAATIYQTLLFIKKHIAVGEQQSLMSKASQKLIQNGFTVDYIALADADNLQPVTEWDGHQPLVAVAAAFLSNVRLIDNMVL
ncbi:MAG: pantoate--beta-alanine ligase [Niabella sp.]